MDANDDSDNGYSVFRTGFTFRDVYQMLWLEVEQNKRRHITRHTVLGKWREIKLKMYEEYCEQWRIT